MEKTPCDALSDPEKLDGRVVYTVKFCRVVKTDKKGERCIELSSQRVIW